MNTKPTRKRGPRGAGRQNPIKPISVTKPSFQRFEEVKKRRTEKENGQIITNDILLMDMMDIYENHLDTKEEEVSLQQQKTPPPPPLPKPAPVSAHDSSLPKPDLNGDSDVPFYRRAGSNAKLGDEDTYRAYLGDLAPFYTKYNGKNTGNPMIEALGYELIYREKICRTVAEAEILHDLILKGGVTTNFALNQ